MSNKLKIKDRNFKFNKYFFHRRIPSYTKNESLNRFIYSFFQFFHIEKESTQLFYLKVIKFIIVGGIATFISGVLFFLCDTFFKLPVLLSNTIAFFCFGCL